MENSLQFSAGATSSEISNQNGTPNETKLDDQSAIENENENKELNGEVQTNIEDVDSESSDEFEKIELSIEMKYIHAYDSYYSWAVHSMDVIKLELLSLCFPIFVHW